MMLDKSWKHLYILIESVFPKALTQLQIAIKLAYESVYKFKLLQCVEIYLYKICLTLSVIASGNFSNISCHLPINTKRAKHLAS
jgi:hypothetical protein